MKGLRPAILLMSVALFAALIAHVTIDVLGDFMLAHDTYDDVDHSSRVIVALATLAIALTGFALGLRAAIREARGSENAFCVALRSTLPRSTAVFLVRTTVLSALVLCVMEGCDALLAGQRVDDLGDLFGGSVPFGGTIVTAIATVLGVLVLSGLRRLARASNFAGVVVAFLRRWLRPLVARHADRDVVQRLIVRSRRVCRPVTGRAPPLPPFATT